LTVRHKAVIFFQCITSTVGHSSGGPVKTLTLIEQFSKYRSKWYKVKEIVYVNQLPVVLVLALIKIESATGHEVTAP